MLENRCKVPVTRGYVCSESDRHPVTMCAKALKCCGVVVVIHEIIEQAQFIWHRNLYQECMTRVGTGWIVGCVAQKKQEAGCLWTEHIFVVCLSSKETSSNLGDRVAACNHS